MTKLKALIITAALLLGTCAGVPAEARRHKEPSLYFQEQLEDFVRHVELIDISTPSANRCLVFYTIVHGLTVSTTSQVVPNTLCVDLYYQLIGVNKPL